MRVRVLTFVFHLHVLDLTAIEDFDSNLVAGEKMLSNFDLPERSNA